MHAPTRLRRGAAAAATCLGLGLFGISLTGMAELGSEMRAAAPAPTVRDTTPVSFDRHYADCPKDGQNDQQHTRRT